MIFGTAFLLFGIWLNPVLGASYRITGWKFEFKSENSQSLYDTKVPLGDTTLRAGESWVYWEGHFCWVGKTINGNGYCHFYFKVTTDETAEHYQLVGGKTNYFDKTSRYPAGESKWGRTTGATEVYAGEGFTWVGSWVKDWGYAQRKFYVEKTTEPSFTQALFRQNIKADERHKTHHASVTGSTSKAQLTKTGEFRGWTSDWGRTTMISCGLYVAATVLKSFEPQMDQKTLLSDNSGKASEIFKERIMVNDGCGETYVPGQTGTLTTSQSITLEETVSWSQEFSFGFSVSYEASFDIGAVSNTMSVSSEFSYSKSEDFSSTQSNTEESSYVWPTHCNPGHKCKTTIYVTEKRYKIPVIFTFKRNGETFTETNYMVANVQSWSDKVWQPEATGNSCRK